MTESTTAFTAWSGAKIKQRRVDDSVEYDVHDMHGGVIVEHARLSDAVRALLNYAGYGRFEVASQADHQYEKRRSEALFYAFGVFDARGEMIPDDVFNWARRCGIEARDFELQRRTMLSSIQDQFTEAYGPIKQQEAQHG